MYMSGVMSLVGELCRLPSGIVNEGNEALFERIAQEVPLSMYRWQSGDSHNGWIVPDLWSVKRAEIRRGSDLIFDGTRSPLGVAAYSTSFTGRVDLATLKQHLYSRSDEPDVQFWHCTWLYRPWINDWAFCPPHRIVEQLDDGDYDIVLETSRRTGSMLLGVHDKRGQSDNTVIFQANTCHPHMANDGFAGVAVMILLFQWLAKRSTRYSYRLVLGPEHLGTVFYLRDLAQVELDRLVGGVFGEMMGTPGPFVVASSFAGDHYLDRVMRHVARHHAQTHHFVGFRESIGNDETVWEAPGFEIPFLQVNRAPARVAPFRGYHSELDTPDIIAPDLLKEFLTVLQKFIEVIENNAFLVRRFDGLIALSNPAYGLYLERSDPAFQLDQSWSMRERWGHLQDCIIRYFDGQTSIFNIAEKHDLSFEAVHAYVKRFVNKELVHLEPHIVSRELVKKAAELRRPR